MSPGDQEPDWSILAPHFRVRYLGSTEHADRSALETLRPRGLVDVGSHLNCRDVPTVPSPSFPEPEFAPFRADHVRVSSALTDLVRGHTVLTDTDYADFSDHLPVVVELDL